MSLVTSTKQRNMGSDKMVDGSHFCSQGYCTSCFVVEPRVLFCIAFVGSVAYPCLSRAGRFL